MFSILIRCGQLTYQLRLPYSYLKHPFVKAAIKATYNGFDQCDCVEVEVEEVVKVVEVVEVEEVVGTTDISVTELVTETPESTTENIITTVSSHTLQWTRVSYRGSISCKNHSS